MDKRDKAELEEKIREILTAKLTQTIHYVNEALQYLDYHIGELQNEKKELEKLIHTLCEQYEDLGALFTDLEELQ